MGHEITSSCVCVCVSRGYMYVCRCASVCGVCLWEREGEREMEGETRLLRGLLTQPIKAVWDSQWDTKGLGMWAPHKQTSKPVPLQNTNIGPYFWPQQLYHTIHPPPNPRPPYQQCIHCLWIVGFDLTGFAVLLKRLATTAAILYCRLYIAVLTVENHICNNDQEDNVKPC